MVQSILNSGMNPQPARPSVTSTSQRPGSTGQTATTNLTNTDKVSLKGDRASSAVYSKEMVVAEKPADINSALRDYVVNLLEKQGVAVKFAIDQEGTEIDLRTITPEQAQELISEDGYFGVEKTSDRIVEFAINAAGADVSKLEEIKAAVMDGFKQAEEAFGGTLADISYDTLDAIMAKLDKWAEEAQSDPEPAHAAQDAGAAAVTG